MQRMPVTGKIEPSGQCINLLRRKLPANITATLVRASQTTAMPPIKRYIVATGVRLSPSVERKVAQIAAAYHAVTGQTIRVTSGTRDPAAQAGAMFNNMMKGDRLTIYKNQALAGPIRSAFDAAQNTGQSDSATIAAMEKVIAAQVARKQYISKHLIAGAVDIRSKTMTTRAQRTAFKSAASAIAHSVILETTDPHWHLQF